ncbi:flavodoxin family protein [Clostridioides sp. ZZV15-6383]|uniref:flavodoxin family protein n=1 Tax=unclassified Clostridioides TaxID=2635829 RepID=UPI001D12E27C
MKSLILYSSLTGNTKKIASSIYDAIQGEKEIKNISELVDNSINYENYDVRVTRGNEKIATTNYRL